MWAHAAELLSQEGISGSAFNWNMKTMCSNDFLVVTSFIPIYCLDTFVKF